MTKSSAIDSYKLLVKSGLVDTVDARATFLAIPASAWAAEKPWFTVNTRIGPCILSGTHTARGFFAERFIPCNRAETDVQS